MANEVKVSILCLAYNHGHYVRKTLDSFLAQQTDFDYEIIIHDDASLDETSEIIREYAQRYPNKIRPVLQKENQHSQKTSIWSVYINPLIQGKYVALCEGDDYWTDPKKLQKQYDVMESNSDCSVCVHSVQHIFEDGTIAPKVRPTFLLKEGKMDTQSFLEIEHLYPFHTSSYFIRTEHWMEYHNNVPSFKKVINVGDRPLMLYMMTKGYLFYLSEIMSAYRMFSAGSWTSRNADPIKRIQNSKQVLDMITLYDEYTGHRYDCNLGIYRGNYLWYSENYRELVKKENREFLRGIPLKKRVYAYGCVVFPFLKIVRGFLRQMIKKVNRK